MAVKRQSAFNRALREAQQPVPTSASTSTPERAFGTEDEPTVVSSTIPTSFVASVPINSPAEVSETVPSSLPSLREGVNRGGRPRNLVPKKKFTYYLPDESDQHIASIKKALVRYADTLVDDKGEVVEQALGVLRFALEDEASRQTFLEIYHRWLTNRATSRAN